MANTGAAAQNQYYDVLQQESDAESESWPWARSGCDACNEMRTCREPGPCALCFVCCDGITEHQWECALGILLASTVCLSILTAGAL